MQRVVISDSENSEFIFTNGNECHCSHENPLTYTQVALSAHRRYLDLQWTPS